MNPSKLKNMRKSISSLLLTLTVTGCALVKEGQPLDAGADSTADGGCTTASDCPVPKGPCRACDDGGFVCPSAKCAAGLCEAVFPDCNDPGCPSDPTASVTCAGYVHCEYGGETCCGRAYPSLVCDCVNGDFLCRNTDACLMPACDGGIPQCTSNNDCAVPALCVMCPDGTCSESAAVCNLGICDVFYPPCPPADAGAD